MKAHQIELCQTIANYYGHESQTMIAIEEMSELIKELCKKQRGYDRHKNITEEIADVSIMIEQLISLYDCKSEVSKMIDYKLERQLRRIENERR